MNIFLVPKGVCLVIGIFCEHEHKTVSNLWDKDRNNVRVVFWCWSRASVLIKKLRRDRTWP